MLQKSDLGGNSKAKLCIFLQRTEGIPSSEALPDLPKEKVWGKLHRRIPNFYISTSESGHNTSRLGLAKSPKGRRSQVHPYRKWFVCGDSTGSRLLSVSSPQGEAIAF